MFCRRTFYCSTALQHCPTVHSKTIPVKCFLVLATWLSLNGSTASFIIVDRDLKKPAEPAANFSLERYLQRRFPVYAAEVQALIEEADKAVKSLDTDSCGRRQEWHTPHTTIFVEQKCDDLKVVNITLITDVEDLSSSFSFALLRNETSRHRAQRVLLDFAAYLNK